MVKQEAQALTEARNRNDRHVGKIAGILFACLNKAEVVDYPELVVNKITDWFVPPLKKDPKFFELSPAISTNIYEIGAPIALTNIEIYPRSTQDTVNYPYPFSFPYPEDVIAYQTVLDALQPENNALSIKALHKCTEEIGSYPRTTVKELGSNLPTSPVYLEETNQILFPTIYPDVMLAVSSATDGTHPWLGLVVRVEHEPFVPLGDIISPSKLAEGYYEKPTGIVNNPISEMVVEYRRELREQLPEMVAEFRKNHTQINLEKQLAALESKKYTIKPIQFIQPKVVNEPALPSILERGRLINKLLQVLDEVVVRPEVSEYDFLAYCKLRFVLALTPDEVISDESALYFLRKFASEQSKLGERLKNFCEQIDGNWILPNSAIMSQKQSIVERAFV